MIEMQLTNPFQNVVDKLVGAPAYYVGSPVIHLGPS